MTKASIRGLRYAFKKIKRLLSQGEEFQITDGRQLIARLIPESEQSAVELPNFLERMRAIYGTKSLPTVGAEVVAADRGQY